MSPNTGVFEAVAVCSESCKVPEQNCAQGLVRPVQFNFYWAQM